jgi:5S rRNA maturation endonuclease (ribonuclease M5)
MNRHPVNTLERFISALEKKDPNWPIRESCGQYYTRCPAHGGSDDDSMSFTSTDDGQLLVTCHSQDCSYEDIMASVGLASGDGFPRPNPRRSVGANPKAKGTMRRQRSSKRASVRAGRHPSPTKQDDSVASRHRVTYDYRDADGNLDRQVVKTIELNAAGGKVGKKIAQRRPVKGGFAYTTKGGWFHSKDGKKYQRIADSNDPRPLKDAVLVRDPVRHLLYRLPEVNEALAAGDTILVVEGEGDVDTLRALGYCATTNAGGAGKWRKEHTEQLAGAKRATIIPDNDDTGRKHACQVGQSLSEVGVDVRMFELPDLDEKGDVTDWVEAGGTKADLEDLIKNAPPWSPIAGEDSGDEDTFEILDHPPSKLTRPLSIDGDTGYLYTRVLGTIGGQTTSADVVRSDRNGDRSSGPPNQLIRQKTRSCCVTYRVTIRLRGLVGEVGSQGSGVEHRRL